MTGLARILPVQIARSPYDVAALNNPFPRHPAAMTSSEPTPAVTPPEPILGEGLTALQQERLTALLAELETLSQELASRPEALLALLRQLEQLHRSLQDGPFRSSLPSDRNRLFEVLQDMERRGGWPYIPRLQLRTFMDLLQQDPPEPSQPLAA
jgi:hypothetical protein